MRGAKPSVGNVIPMKGDREIKPPDAPDMMTEPGRAVWDELAPVLASKQRLRVEFKFQFAAYCEAVAKFLSATNEIAMVGYWYETKTRNGVQQKATRPVVMQSQAVDEMNRLSALFGLTPVDDKRVGQAAQGNFLDELKEAMADAPD